MGIYTKSINKNGGSLIEFAIVAPLLFLILFGIIEFGFLLYDKAVLTNACREGARDGIVFDKTRRTAAEITDVVTTYCGANLISFAPSASVTVNVSWSSDPPASGDSLTVRVTYPFKFLILSSLVKFFGVTMDAGVFNLYAEGVMRME